MSRGGTPLTLLPALDLRGGRVAQLADDDPDASSPERALDRVLATGARWVHLVDLGRAFGAEPDPGLLAALVARARAAGAAAQLSGGIADADTLAWALRTGADRVCLSPLALRDPDAVRAAVGEHGPRVALGLDVRDGAVVARGTDAVLGDLEDWLARVSAWEPVALLVADAARDGSRRGVDLDLFTRVADARPASVRTLIASGGVRDADDLAALDAVTGVDAVVLGAAVHTGGLDLAAALTRGGAA